VSNYEYGVQHGKKERKTTISRVPYKEDMIRRENKRTHLSQKKKDRRKISEMGVSSLRRLKKVAIKKKERVRQGPSSQAFSSQKKREKNLSRLGRIDVERNGNQRGRFGILNFSLKLSGKEGGEEEGVFWE